MTYWVIGYVSSTCHDMFHLSLTPEEVCALQWIQLGLRDRSCFCLHLSPLKGP